MDQVGERLGQVDGWVSQGLSLQCADIRNVFNLLKIHSHLIPASLWYNHPAVYLNLQQKSLLLVDDYDHHRDHHLGCHGNDLEEDLVEEERFEWWMDVLLLVPRFPPPTLLPNRPLRPPLGALLPSAKLICITRPSRGTPLYWFKACDRNSWVGCHVTASDV